MGMRCEEFESCLPVCECCCDGCVCGWCDYWIAQGGPFAIIDGDLKVELIYIGEGNSGDYNPDDLDDAELLRFYVSRWVEGPEYGDIGEWEDVDRGSYCTQMTTNLPADRRAAALETIMNVVKSCIDEADGSFKRRMEELSWEDGRVVLDGRIQLGGPMSYLGAQELYHSQDYAGGPIAWCHPASSEAVALVMSKIPWDEDGRSEWLWIRLENGDLILGVFPQGETYFAVEEDADMAGRTYRQEGQ